MGERVGEGVGERGYRIRRRISEGASMAILIYRRPFAGLSR